MHNRFLLITLSAALLAGCATVTNPVTGQQERTVMDERSEIAEGRKAHEEVLQEYGVYANPRLQAYVNELGQRLAKQSHRKNLEWHFTVLDSPEINAFALPGGYVYVTCGLMAHNQIAVKPAAAPADAKAPIEAALKRNALVDSAHIKVQLAHGVIGLRGIARSRAEYEEAMRAAWSAPGITRIEDHITIGSLRGD